MVKEWSGSGEICVVGNLNMDLLVRGITSLPQWGQEVVGTQHRSFPAGQAGYLGLAIAALDTPVSMVGVVGEDEAGREIVRALWEAGADTSGVTLLADEQTGLTIALVRPDGERAFASNIGCSGRLTAEMLESSSAHASTSEVVALVGLFMVANLQLSDAHAFLARCRSEGRTTVLDTGWDPQNWQPKTITGIRQLLEEVDLFLPNLDEAQAITGQDRPEHALAALSNVCPGTIVIKCGSEGSIAWHEGRIIRHGAFETAVVDAVGAGDVFNAGLLTSLVAGVPIESALTRAHATASIYVSRDTNRYPRPADVDALIARTTTNK